MANKCSTVKVYREVLLKMVSRLRALKFPRQLFTNVAFYNYYWLVTICHLCIYWLPCYLYSTIFVHFIMTYLKTAECPSKYIADRTCNLGEMLDSTSTLFADYDYTNVKNFTGGGGGKVPYLRTSVSVVIFQLNGQMSLDQVEHSLEKSILAAEKSPFFNKMLSINLQSYPFNWVGYWFWKRDVIFSVKNHVHELKHFGKKWNRRALARLHQKLLNEQWPERKSPWSVTLVEPSVRATEHTTIVCLKFHQCLGRTERVADFFAKSLQISLSHSAQIVTSKTCIKTSGGNGDDSKGVCSLFKVLQTNVSLLVYRRQAQKHPWRLPSNNHEDAAADTTSCTCFVRFSENIAFEYIQSIAGYHEDLQISAVLLSVIVSAIENYFPDDDISHVISKSPILLSLVKNHHKPLSTILDISSVLTTSGETEDFCAWARIKHFNDLIVSSSSVEQNALDRMVSSLGEYLVQPWRRTKLSALNTFPTSITIFEEVSDDEDKEEDKQDASSDGEENDEEFYENNKMTGLSILRGGLQCTDLSISGNQAVPSTSAGVSFNAYCYQDHVSFCVLANARVLNEQQCEKIVKLLENEILKAWAWSTIPQ